MLFLEQREEITDGNEFAIEHVTRSDYEKPKLGPQFFSRFRGAGESAWCMCENIHLKAKTN